MYPQFLQFTMPKVGQAAVAVLLYFCFLDSPLLQPLQGWPLLYYLIPLAAVALLSWYSRDPLGSGMVAVGYYVALSCVDWALRFAANRLGGTVLRVYHLVSLWGITPALLTVAVLVAAWFRARRLYVTTYHLSTEKPLPGGHLRVVQLSDLHPNPRAALHRGRIPELREKLAALHADMLVFTGDVFDEFTPREEFDAFTSFFAELEAPLGKYFVFGNHDLFHHWQDPCYDRADLETAMAAAKVRVLEDVAVYAGQPPVRVVGRKDYMATDGRRAAAGELCHPDGTFTVWLDHEPRDLKAAAAAGADLILCGHTHGGQIWPGGVAGRMVNEMNYGLRQVGGAAAITSGGTGTWGYRLRTQGRTELVCVEVESVCPAAGSTKN